MAMDQTAVTRDLANRAARAAYTAAYPNGLTENEREAWLTATRDKILNEWTKSTETVNIVFDIDASVLAQLCKFMKSEISNQLSDLVDDKFEEVTNDLEKKVSDMEDTVEDFDKRFDKIEELELDDIKDSVSDCVEKVEDVDTRVTDLEDDKEKLEDRISSIESDMDKIYGKVDADKKMEEVAKATSDRHMIRHKMEYHGYTDQGAAAALVASTFQPPENGLSSLSPHQS